MAEAYDKDEILESLAFGVEFEFLVDVRAALGEDHKFCQRVPAVVDSDPSAVARAVAPVVKMHLERLGLTQPVSVSNKVLHGTYENEAELAEDELQYRHWIVTSDDSVEYEGHPSVAV